jgi:hypothetical protein
MSVNKLKGRVKMPPLTKVEQIQSEIDNKNAAIEQEAANGQQTNHDQIILWRAEIATLTEQLAAEKLQQEQEGRQQAQEEKVAAVTLPYDFSETFDDPRANEIITELIQQYQRQAYEEHNAEITELVGKNKDELRAAADRESQLQRQNSEIQNALEAERQQAKRDAQEFTGLEHHIAQLQLEKQHAESKRDAAVRELDEAKTEINQLKGWNYDLQEKLNNAPAPKAAIDISGSDKLSQLVKESNEAKAARGLQRWATMLPEVVAPPVLPSLENNNSTIPPELPPELPNVGTDFRPQEVPSTAVGLDGNTATAEVVGPAESQVTRAEHDALAARVTIIERHANIQAVA